MVWYDPWTWDGDEVTGNEPAAPQPGNQFEQQYGNLSREEERRRRMADGNSKEQYKQDLGRAAPGGGDYSNAAAERRRQYEEYQKDRGGTGMNAGVFQNPGSADYGGWEGGVDYYAEQARQGGMANDAQQAANEAAMGRTSANMTADRGNVFTENAGLVRNEGNTRNQQLQALDLTRQAALGNAPSEAAFQTRIGMGDIMSAQSGNLGQARGLAALSGAQNTGGALVGQSASNLAMQGGLGRSKEIADAIGMYGTQAGDVRDQDLARLNQNTQGSVFNAKANDAWKIGNAELLAKQGQLGAAQAGTDQAWMTEQGRGMDKQFQYDQEMAALEAGADADKVGAQIAANREDKENRRQLVNGAVTTGLTAVGTAAGGPIGGAAGATAGGAFGASTKDWDW